MRRLILFLAAVLIAPLLASVAVAAPAKPAPKLETAVFAGGCFWCMESDMKGIPGVVSVESGYTGGKLKNPSYQDVLTEKTGHYEAVRVRFDPSKISYAGSSAATGSWSTRPTRAASSATVDRNIIPPCSSARPTSGGSRSRSALGRGNCSTPRSRRRCCH